MGESINIAAVEQLVEYIVCLGSTGVGSCKSESKIHERENIDSLCQNKISNWMRATLTQKLLGVYGT